MTESNSKNYHDDAHESMSDVGAPAQLSVSEHSMMHVVDLSRPSLKAATLPFPVVANQIAVTGRAEGVETIVAQGFLEDMMPQIRRSLTKAEIEDFVNFLDSGALIEAIHVLFPDQRKIRADSTRLTFQKIATVLRETSGVESRLACGFACTLLRNFGVYEKSVKVIEFKAGGNPVEPLTYEDFKTTLLREHAAAIFDAFVVEASNIKPPEKGDLYIDVHIAEMSRALSHVRGNLYHTLRLSDGLDDIVRAVRYRSAAMHQVPTDYRDFINSQAVIQFADIIQIHREIAANTAVVEHEFAMDHVTVRMVADELLALLRKSKDVRLLHVRSYLKYFRLFDSRNITHVSLRGRKRVAEKHLMVTLPDTVYKPLKRLVERSVETSIAQNLGLTGDAHTFLQKVIAKLEAGRDYLLGSYMAEFQTNRYDTKLGIASSVRADVLESVAWCYAFLTNCVMTGLVDGVAVYGVMLRPGVVRDNFRSPEITLGLIHHDLLAAFSQRVDPELGTAGVIDGGEELPSYKDVASSLLSANFADKGVMQEFAVNNTIDVVTATAGTVSIPTLPVAHHVSRSRIVAWRSSREQLAFDVFLTLVRQARGAAIDDEVWKEVTLIDETVDRGRSEAFRRNMRGEAYRIIGEALGLLISESKYVTTRVRAFRAAYAASMQSRPGISELVAHDLEALHQAAFKALLRELEWRGGADVAREIYDIHAELMNDDVYRQAYVTAVREALTLNESYSAL